MKITMIKSTSMNIIMKTRTARLEQTARLSASKCEWRGRVNVIQPNSDYVRQVLWHQVLVPHLQKPICFCMATGMWE